MYKRESMQIPACGQMKRILENMEEIICTFFSMAQCTRQQYPAKKMGTC